jgi:hypothetical protein
VGAPWQAFGRMGIHWARDYSWGWLGHGETVPFGNGRDFLAVWQDAARNGVEVLPITQAAFRNKAETGFEEDSAAITEGFRRLAAAFPGVPYWEIDNEFEFALRDRGFDVADYVRALNAAADGLARAGDARLVLNGTAGIRQDLAEAILASDARDASPVINSHCYTGTQPPETGLDDTNTGTTSAEHVTFPQRLRDISRLAHAAGKESWLTEIGWDVTNGPAVGEDLQAVYLPRVYLLSLLCGVDKVFWFYDRDVPDATGIFSTCGLIRLDGSLRPSGVAMAELSRQVARATVAGSLDLGEDIWAAVLRQPEGDFTVAAWSVEGPHPVPAELQGVPARDIFGNAVTPAGITPRVTYFRLATLPAAWDLQRQATWESPDALSACPSGEVTARVACPAAQVTWEALPPGVQSGGWHADGNGYADTLQVAPDMAVGPVPLTARATGQGWTRAWRVTLLVKPALSVTGPVTYEPNQPELLEVTSPLAGQPVTVRLLDDPGTVAPATFTLAEGRTQRLAVVPSADASTPLRVEFSLPSGIRQEFTLRPLRTPVPRLAGDDPPADLAQWPAASLLPAEPGQAVRLHLAWSPRGLAFAAELPIRYLTPGNPDAFWDFTNVELFVDPAGGQGGWTDTCRQIWLTPIQQGGAWSLAAGQWRRIGASGSAPEMRCQTAVTVRGEWALVAGLLPPEVLGKAPEPGAKWRAALSVRGSSPGAIVEAAWPRAKSQGLLNGPGSWGVIEFQ